MRARNAAGGGTDDPGDDHVLRLHRRAQLPGDDVVREVIQDINISGQVATAVADKLIKREIPFLFISGYEKMRGIRYASIPLLRKPFEPEDLRDAIERVLRR
jgi:FixJ family two-component response regulator